MQQHRQLGRTGNGAALTHSTLFELAPIPIASVICPVTTGVRLGGVHKQLTPADLGKRQVVLTEAHSFLRA
jgi:hypothetical protein